MIADQAWRDPIGSSPLPRPGPVLPLACGVLRKESGEAGRRETLRNGGDPPASGGMRVSEPGYA
jgi:hypothetical protein